MSIATFGFPGRGWKRRKDGTHGEPVQIIGIRDAPGSQFLCVRGDGMAGWIDIINVRTVRFEHQDDMSMWEADWRDALIQHDERAPREHHPDRIDEPRAPDPLDRAIAAIERRT